MWPNRISNPGPLALEEGGGGVQQRLIGVAGLQIYKYISNNIFKLGNLLLSTQEVGCIFFFMFCPSKQCYTSHRCSTCMTSCRRCLTWPSSVVKGL